MSPRFYFARACFFVRSSNRYGGFMNVASTVHLFDKQESALYNPPS